MSQLRLQGYVHNVSATRKSQKRSFPYFTFSVQVSDKLTHRGVCYDTEKQPILKGYEESKEPATLINITRKRNLLDPSQDDIIVNKRSRIQAAKPMDIPYKYDESLTLECTEEVTPLDKIASLTANHITSIKGVLTLRAEHIKEITMKSGNVVPMLNHCVITDNTDTVRLALWGTTIKEVTNKFSYIISHVRVKEFDGVKYLTSTPSTTVTPTEEHFPLPTQELFDSFFQTATTLVDQIRLAESFQKWLSCTKCTKPLPEPTAATMVKCENCGTAQPLSFCSINASVRIAVRRNSDHELIWLTAFNPILKQMLDQLPSDVSLQSPEEEIYSQLFKLENFTVEYSEASSVIKDISF